MLQVSNEINEAGICVIIPTYNNSRTLASIIDGVLAYSGNVIVVNDGSTDETSAILAKYPQITQLANQPNQGKGVALYKGMKHAANLGYKYAITIDSDGQHSPNDIPKFIEKLKETGPALIIGNRYMEKDKVPGKSYFGRDFSNFWFWVETGLKNPDTQSGFRLYPLEPISKMKLFTRKFEFEIEIIVRLAWKGIKVESVPVSVVYFDKSERVSHFRPFKDFTRISILNTVLVTLAFLYFRPRLYLANRKISEIFFDPAQSDYHKASSIAFGVFMGILPIWGFQMLVALALAFVLKLNKALVIVFANISLPPLIPAILYLSMLCGQIWVENPVDVWLWPLNIENVKPYLTQYLLGSISLAIIAGAFAWGLSYALLTTKKTYKRQSL